MKPSGPLIVGIGGTLRNGSSSERALRITLAEAERLGATTRIFAGQLLNLPPYDPADPSRTAEAAEMVEALREADGLVIATPSYHGSVSGLIKNALDYTEDLRDDARIYLSDRAVGTIVCAAGVQAMGSTLATLRAIVHALRGWPTPFSAVVNSAHRPFDLDGKCTDLQVCQQLMLVAEQVVEFARMRLRRDTQAGETPRVRKDKDRAGIRVSARGEEGADTRRTTDLAWFSGDGYR
jgi:FMN reductase